MIGGGFPHSEIFGSKLVRSSPKLIAAYHVLHRLSAPRHPPNALKALDRSHHRCPPLGSGGPGHVRNRWAIDEERPVSCSNVPGKIHAVRHECTEVPRSRDHGRTRSLFTMSWITRTDRSRPRSSSFSRMNRSGSGGAGRDRTDDLMLAKHALSRLSYGPIRRPRTRREQRRSGGPGTTRTSDLTLIRGAL
jgi:hypothetical protein